MRNAFSCREGINTGSPAILSTNLALMNTQTQEFNYSGTELELFSKAKNWKSYWRHFLTPYIGKNALDVGAGIGATIFNLQGSGIENWTAVEPDSRFAEVIAEKGKSGEFLVTPRIIVGILKDVPWNEKFDTIFYIDVLEHIENDAEELVTAASRLAPGGRIVILAPAHQFLFSEFDSAVGHHRRYNKKMLRSIVPSSTQIERLAYLDSAGLAASLANRILLHQSLPSISQVSVWDRYLVPVSTFLDRITLNKIGKSIVLILKKGNANAS